MHENLNGGYSTTCQSCIAGRLPLFPKRSLSPADEVVIAGFTDCMYGRFKIQDDEIGSDDLAAWACIRLDRLQCGIRLVHLMDALGTPTKGFLLVKIDKVYS